VGGLAQQGPDARDGRGAGSGSAHDDASLRLELRMCAGRPSQARDPAAARDRVLPIRGGSIQGVVGGSGRLAWNRDPLGLDRAEAGFWRFEHGDGA
jgi:hypothetical protein